MKLKTIALIGAAGLAIMFAATNARADYIGGDSPRKGKQCFAYTDGLGHGFWTTCPKPAKVAKKKSAKKKKDKK